MEDNQSLKHRMAEAGFTQAELAEVVNADLRAAGYEGSVSDRTVRNWLTGKTRWPHRRQRAALEAVFQCPAVELGFVPRRTAAHPMSPEGTVIRRQFMSASLATAVGAVGTNEPVRFHAARARVGSGDVQRLLNKFAALVSNDVRYGGKLAVETQASALAGQALALQAHGSASQRVRDALYGCAASFTSSAMWAAIDCRRFDTAQRHFDRASSLAAMSGDPAIQFRIWSHAGSLYRHIGRPSDALAANDVARNLPVARRDPMFASLGHARHAAIYGLVGDSRAARQALGHARDAYERADRDVPRPLWMTAVCDQAELEELALSTHLSLRHYADAEAHAHKSLAFLRPYMRRDRAIVTARLAHAQLGQGDAEAAVATALSVPADLTTRHPRVSDVLLDFGRALRATAPTSPSTRTWNERTDSSWRSAR
ncbi:helix-turn-helix transcriptional regulator [Streptomyces sp. NBC_01716]|uniref:helix-turn-helix transcriptional regulator n=1 Tax=Streptomyces sp. NBC_01716 TaxID=2975917 RepID=UPI002E2F19F3|nr:helix-turn-helix transcriptional regulator [Streptomyces sp. NBC_01716]